MSAIVIAVLPVALDVSAQGKVPNLLDEYVLTAVSKAGRYAAIGQDDINAMLGFEKQKDLLGCDEMTCFAEMGGALGGELEVVARFGDKSVRMKGV